MKSPHVELTLLHLKGVLFSSAELRVISSVLNTHNYKLLTHNLKKAEIIPNEPGRVMPLREAKFECLVDKSIWCKTRL